MDQTVLSPEGSRETWKLRRFFLLTSCLISAALTLWLYHQQNNYFKLHPYFYDGATYLFEHLRLTEILDKEGFLPAFQYNLLHNAKEPLRPALMLFWPDLMRNTQGFILLIFPLLWWFFFRCQQITFRRSGNVLLSCSSILIFTSFGMVYDTFLGLGAYWHDFFAGILLACALSEFRLFQINKQENHLLLTGLFLAMCGLARYEAYFYAFVVFGPILLSHIVSNYPKNFKLGLRQLSMLALPVILLSSYHITKHLEYIYEYNTKLNYGLGKSLRDSVWYTRTGLFRVSNAGFVLMLFAYPAIAAIQRKNLKKYFLSAESLPALWVCLSMPLLWAIVLRASGSGAYFYLLFAFPLFVIASLGWLPMPVIKNRLIPGLVMAAGLLISLSEGFKHYRKMQEVSTSEKNALLIQDGIVKTGIFNPGEKKSIAVLYNEDIHPLYLRIYSQTSCLPKPVDSLIFSIHSNYYPAFYNTENPDSLSKIIQGCLKRQIHYAVALKHPSTADTLRPITEKLPRLIARNLSAALLADSTNWATVNTLPSALFGELVILRNKGLCP